MENVLHRPFYREFAWAYDLIITGSISNRCDFIERIFLERGVLSVPVFWMLGVGQVITQLS